VREIPERVGDRRGLEQIFVFRLGTYFLSSGMSTPPSTLMYPTTYAPSVTNRFAVARPMPLLPPGDKCHLAIEFSTHCDRSLLVVSTEYVCKATHAASGGQKTSARTSILSRGAALGGLLGSSNEVCAVKRARPSFIES
jgi:hypothetical protein